MGDFIMVDLVFTALFHIIKTIQKNIVLLFLLNCSNKQNCCYQVAFTNKNYTTLLYFSVVGFLVIHN